MPGAAAIAYKGDHRDRHNQPKCMRTNPCRGNHTREKRDHKNHGLGEMSAPPRLCWSCFQHRSRKTRGIALQQIGESAEGGDGVVGCVALGCHPPRGSKGADGKRRGACVGSHPSVARSSIGTFSQFAALVSPQKTPISIGERRMSCSYIRAMPNARGFRARIADFTGGPS